MLLRGSFEFKYKDEMGVNNHQQKQVELRFYNPVYDAIHNYEYLLPPISGTIIGGVNYGIYGAAAGLALGTGDLIANSFGLYEKPYLTSAVLGSGMAASFQLPYYIGESIGFAGGLLVPTGIFDDYLDKAATPLSGAISGYASYGPPGAAIGVGAGIIDETLSFYNVTHSQPCTSTLGAVAATNLIMPQIGRMTSSIIPDNWGLLEVMSSRAVTTPIGVSVGAYLSSKYHGEERKKWPALELGNKLYDAYLEILPREQFDKIIQDQAIALVTTQLLAANIAIGIAGREQNIHHSIALFNTNRDRAWDGFVENFGRYAGFIFPYVGGILSEVFINNYFAKELSYVLKDSLSTELLEGEAALKVINDKTANSTDPNTLLQNINNDIATMTLSGTNLLGGALASVIKGTYGTIYLTSIGGQDIIIYSSVYNKIVGQLSHFTSQKIISFAGKIKQIQAAISSIEEHVRINPDIMVQREANNFIKQKLEALRHSLRKTMEEQSIWDLLYNGWSATRQIADFLCNFLIIADKLRKGSLEFDQRYKAMEMVREVSAMSAWETNNVGDIAIIEQAMGRVEELLAKIRKEESDCKSDVKFSYHESEQPKICFSDLTVGVADTVLVHIDDLCIEDKIVAVTGKSGCGKTTLLKILKNIKHDVAWGRGEIDISTPKGEATESVMISQRDYLPPYTSLLELITFKVGDEAKAIEDFVRELLIEIEIDSDVTNGGEEGLLLILHEEKVWDSHLSGGQKKKIAVLSLILQQPDVAILDEILTGLDHHSVKLAQEMLHKYLPNTMFLIVDHHAGANNHDGFYERELHFEDGKAEFRDIDASREKDLQNPPYASITEVEVTGLCPDPLDCN